MASTFLTRTNSSSPSNANITTMSVWIKLSKILSSTEHMGILGSNAGGGYGLAGASQIGFYNGGLYVWLLNSSGTYFKQQSTRLLRDPNAWYHIVVRLDSTQSSGDNRIKVWVNNEEITAWNSITDMAQNTPVNINGTNDIRVGRYTFTDGTHNYFNGSMSHFHLCDGQSYAPTEFGEYDANGVWKIKTEPSVTYGTNGFFILKDGNSVTDQSGNGNNFTVGGGTLTNTEDNPSNVFATLNPLNQNPSNAFVLQNGNLSVASSTAVGTKNHGSSTLGASSGKWYCEFKIDSGLYSVIGVSFDPSELARNNQDCGYYSSGWGYYQGLGTIRNNDSGSAYGDTLSAGDILGIALDLDNSKLYFAKNGVWQNSGDPTSGATGTGAVSITSGETYFFVTGDADATTVTTTSANFGNGYFGTTAVSSAGTNASGNGIFEYDVPTGYTALSTKGLNL